MTALCRRCCECVRCGRSACFACFSRIAAVQACGQVNSWKRAADAETGSFKRFGHVEFAHPRAALLVRVGVCAWCGPHNVSCFVRLCGVWLYVIV